MDNRTYRADDQLNQFSDRNESWGPLLFLRPERHQPLTLTRVLLISAMLGGFYGMLGNVAVGLLLRPGASGRPSVLLMPVLLTAMHFVCGQLSLVAAWNRRARLLSRQIDWAEESRRPLRRSRDDQQPAE